MPSGMPYLAAADWISRSQAPVEATASEVNAASAAAAASTSVLNTSLACTIEASIRPLCRLIVALARLAALPLLGRRLLLGGLALVAGVGTLDRRHADGDVFDCVTLAAQSFENLAVIFLHLTVSRPGFDLEVDVQS